MLPQHNLQLSNNSNGNNNAGNSLGVFLNQSSNQNTHPQQQQQQLTNLPNMNQQALNIFSNLINMLQSQQQNPSMMNGGFQSNIQPLSINVSPASGTTGNSTPIQQTLLSPTSSISPMLIQNNLLSGLQQQAKFNNQVNIMSPVSTATFTTSTPSMAGDVDSSNMRNAQENQQHQTFISKSNTMGASFKQFFNNQTMSDVTFIIQGKKFFAHKLILCARSEYFYQLILIKCPNSSVLEIEIQDASADIFYNVLEFVYTDCTILRSDKIWDLYQAAKFYQLNPLSHQCQEFIIGTLGDSNVFQQWVKSQNYGAILVAEHCLHFVKSKFEQALKVLGIYDNLTISTNPEDILTTMSNQQHVIASLLGSPQNVTPNNTNQKSNGSDMYNSLTSFTFPPPKENKKGSDQGSSLNAYKFPPGSSEEAQPLKSDAEDNEKHELTQTFELWGEENVPPAAFPTRYSMDQFPAFFRLENGIDKEEPKPKSKETVTRDDKEKGCVFRRLSVLRQDIHSIGVFLQHVISCLTRLLHAERTTLFMYDKTTDELISQVSIGENEIRIPSDKGIVGSCFTSGKSINVVDASSDSKFASDVDMSTGFSTKSVICSPIIGSDNQYVGVLEVLNKHNGSFTESDQQVLKIICELLSIFVQEQQIEEMENIHKSTILLHPSSYRRKSVAPTTNINPTAKTALRKMSVSLDDTFALLFDDGDFNFDLTNNDEPSLLSVNNDLATSMTGPNIDPLWNYVQTKETVNPTSTFVAMDAASSYTVNTTDNPSAQTMTNDSTQATPLQMQPPKQKKAQESGEKKRKRQTPTPAQSSNSSMPFMHFRIPRYELQFIQFDAAGQKKKKKA